MFETRIIQASLLQSYYGLFCGSQKLFQQAESLRGTLVTACKRMHLLRPGRTALEALHSQSRSPVADEVQSALAEDKRRHRLGWGIYVSFLPILR